MIFVPVIGNPRGHENPFLLAFGILWFRWHNIKAGHVATANPDFTDEQIFHHARRLVTAQYQVSKQRMSPSSQQD